MFATKVLLVLQMFRLLKELGDWCGMARQSLLARECLASICVTIRRTKCHCTSSRLPLIVWSQSSVADFVKKEQLGIAIDSLYELEQRLSEITEDEYMRMQKNVQALSEKLSSGQMLRCALSEVVSYTKNLV